MAKEAEVGNSYFKKTGRGEVYCQKVKGSVIPVVFMLDFDCEKDHNLKKGEKEGDYGIKDEGF